MFIMLDAEKVICFFKYNHTSFCSTPNTQTSNNF